MMDDTHDVTRWTVRVAMLLFVASLAARRHWRVWSRLAWTAGCLAYLLHVAAAFHYYHHWSHAEAYDFTARETARTVGLDWGGGLYVNYAFTLVWLADVVWWWRDPERPSIVLQCVILGFLGFVAFNAVVVFPGGWIRWFGVAGCGLILIGALWPKRKEHAQGDHHGRASVDGGDRR